MAGKKVTLIGGFCRGTTRADHVPTVPARAEAETLVRKLYYRHAKRTHLEASGG